MTESSSFEQLSPMNRVVAASILQVKVTVFALVAILARRDPEAAKQLERLISALSESSADSDIREAAEKALKDVREAVRSVDGAIS